MPQSGLFPALQPMGSRTLTHIHRPSACVPRKTVAPAMAQRYFAPPPNSQIASTERNDRTPTVSTPVYEAGSNYTKRPLVAQALHNNHTDPPTAWAPNLEPAPNNSTDSRPKHSTDGRKSGRKSDHLFQSQTTGKINRPTPALHRKQGPSSPPIRWRSADRQPGSPEPTMCVCPLLRWLCRHRHHLPWPGPAQTK